MTEEDWLSGSSSGRLLEYTRRIVELTPQARGRKYRCIAVEIMREFLPANPDANVVAVLEAVERMCDGRDTLREVAAAIRAAGFPARSDIWPNWGTIVEYLAAADSLVCVRGVAGHTQLGPYTLSQLIGTVKPPFVAVQCRIIRDIFGNPFRPVSFSPEWRTDTAMSLARGMYESRDFGAMPIFADALQDAGCDYSDVLNHCRDAKQAHVRGCWVVDLVLGKA